jgi:hypothetical protein
VIIIIVIIIVNRTHEVKQIEISRQGVKKIYLTSMLDKANTNLNDSVLSVHNIIISCVVKRSVGLNS